MEALRFNLLLVYIGSLTFLLSSGLRQEIPTIEIGTKYSTRDVQLASQESTGVYIASTCGQLQGKSLNVTILLNNNPSWLPQKGVIYFYVVDSLDKTADEALCSNHASGVAVPNCLVSQWSTTNDVYIKTTAGQVAAIAFTMTMDVVVGSSFDSKVEKPLLWSSPHGKFPFTAPITYPGLQAVAYYLTQTVHVSADHQLAYLDEVILNVSFCPNEETTDRYTIESTVFGVDGASAFAQYICNGLPCQVDSHVEEYNGNQLPSNTVQLTTSNYGWKKIYVLLVGWGGSYDLAVDNYVGNFQYSATILKNP